MTDSNDEVVLLYDGLCGFCDRVVQFVLARDRKGTMKFAPLQGAYALGVLSRHPAMQNVDSLVLVRVSEGTETVVAQSEAVADILRYLGGVWSLLGALMRIVPRFVADAGYAAFARIRYRVFGRYNACPIPAPAQRARFIDPAIHER
jgi:predicted DCC family thiol-disulfide oxidoreductase YuxK